jgi:hypothetical protein
MNWYLKPEVAQAAIQAIQSLQDIVGYHLPWCPCYALRRDDGCTCGMYQVRLMKSKLQYAVEIAMCGCPGPCQIHDAEAQPDVL